MHRNLFAVMAGILLWGCAGPQRFSTATLPNEGRAIAPGSSAVQRGVLSIRGRQFILNGYIVRQTSGRTRLLISENLGRVLAELEIDPAGKIDVLQCHPPLRRDWVERYIAADLQCVMSGRSSSACPVTWVGPMECVIKRPMYQLDLRTLELKPSDAEPRGFTP